MQTTALPAIDLGAHSLEQLLAIAETLAAKDPAKTAEIYAEVVERVCEFEEKIRYQDLADEFERQAYPDASSPD